MRAFKFYLFIASIVFILIGCSNNTIIELPLTSISGYGPFNTAFAVLQPYSEEESNPWKKTYLKVNGVPLDLTDLIFGDIDIDIYQDVYQNYLSGNISREMYYSIQKSWDWEPDTFNLSKEPVKCKIAFAFGKDSTGTGILIVDTNNNLDLSDEEPFIPIDLNSITNIDKDSIVFEYSVRVLFETSHNNKKVVDSTLIFIAYMKRSNMLMYNFPQYSTAEFEGEQIAVCSDNFTNLIFDNPIIALGSDLDKIENRKLLKKNEYLEVHGEIYRIIGVNRFRKSLMLEQTELPKHELYSTQVGYKPYPFGGSDFIRNSRLLLEDFEGKYVYLDFWGHFCKPCIQELPRVTELYNKVDTTKIEFIGIACDTPPNVLEELINDLSVTWPQIVSDHSNNIKEKYGINSFPTTFLLNPEGIIIEKGLRGKALEKRVLEILELNGKEPDDYMN